MYSHRIVSRFSVSALIALCPVVALAEANRPQGATIEETFTAVEALVDLSLSPSALEAAGLRASLGDRSSRDGVARPYSFSLASPGTMFQIVAVDASLTRVLGGSMQVSGESVLLQAADETAVSIDTLHIATTDSHGESLSAVITRDGSAGEALFVLADARVTFDRVSQTLAVRGGLLLADELAGALGTPAASAASVGRFTLTARMRLTQAAHLDGDGAVTSVVLPGLGGEPEGPGTVCDSIGADVIVGDLPSIANYASLAGVEAFAVGTTSCNIGDAELLWISGTNEHPVIGQNMYRLKTMIDGQNRFEHIGQSWLKHGFTALQGSVCSSGNPNCTCISSGTGARLGVGCSDPYGSGLNGSQSGLGPRFEVNPTTGIFSYPFTQGDQGPTGDTTYKRIQVKISNLDPALDGGGQYFVDGHYVAVDDSASGNQNNSASYRSCTVTGSGSAWNASTTGATQREQPALRAWQDSDPTVTETDVQVPGTGGGLVIVSSQATNLGGGMWHYEYAVQNLNVHRGFSSFRVPVDSGATNIGFHDVDYHSGDGESGATRDGTDWSATVGGGAVTWTMTDLAGDNDNALLWGTIYNFRFDAPVAPHAFPIDVTLGMWRPGAPISVNASTVGPAQGPTDCNNNGVTDDQDITNGTSQDCAGGGPNGILDECEVPCTLRGRQVASGLSSPLHVASDGVNANRLYIVERAGRIKILDLTTGTLSGTNYMDISVLTTTSGERGLLSVAFHPQFGAGSPFVFVNYTNTAGNTVVARYTTTGSVPGAATVDAGSAVILKTITQTFSNHNGGQVQFGSDGMFYVGMGDGGGGDDPNNASQNDSSLLGKMLRLDVDNPPLYIPVDNPFVGPGAPLDEIWAKGLRNPWRFSFDALTGDMYIGDVGQSAREEIDFQSAGSIGGENYGWDCREGLIASPATGDDCTDPPYVDPILDVAWGSAGTCSITGGHVYRGCNIPGLSGTYFYADWCGNWIRSFAYADGDLVPPAWTDRTSELTPLIGSIDQVVSFGEDIDGELYWVNLTGSVYKIECALPPECGNGILEPGEQCDDGNTTNGDGCNQNCLTEGICGNGVIELGEECDDGNTTPGDGCSEFCLIETADHCATPSPVTEGTFAFDTTGADTDGPANAACQYDGQTYHDIWYEYTPDCSGNLTVSLCGSAYDTDLVIYNGCDCAALALNMLGCNDDNCGGSFRSELPWAAGGFPTIPVVGGNCYLIRVGGWNSGDQGAGTMTITNSAVPCSACGDGVVNPGEECDDGNTTPGDGCDGFCQVEGDYLTGGRMYDNWWTQSSLPAPTIDHPLWAFRPDMVSNPATGSATWRCKECHGWDYKGATGVYGSGTHRTGFPGILGSTISPAKLLTLLTQPPNNGGGPGVANGHDLGSTGLTTPQIQDLIAFALGGQGTVNDDLYINPVTGDFNGNQVAGQTNYTTTGSCTVCHGSDGAQIEFGGNCLAPEYVGTVAFNNPWEMLHKVRFGQPATPMPSWEATNPIQGAVDIGEYAQNVLAVECSLGAPCTQCDDGNECTDDSCDGRFCDFINNTALCLGGTGVCVSGVCQVCADPCSDGDACTISDACAGGLCQGTAVDCSLAGTDCIAAGCSSGGPDGNCDTLTPINEGGLCNGGSGTCAAGVCIDPGATRVFMTRAGVEASAPAAGTTTLTMAAGTAATIEVWIADTDPEPLGGYQMVLPGSATPQMGAAGTVDYVDNPGTGDSVFIDTADPDWAFAGMAGAQTFLSETGLPVGFALLATLDLGVGVSISGLSYLGEFQFAASGDASGTFTLGYIPDGQPPNGGSGLVDSSGAAPILANYQPLEIVIADATTCSTVGDCADVDQNGITDDACTWFDCDALTCVSVPRIFGDAGGSFGVCPIDGFANIHDRNHALSCFSGTNVCDPFNHDLGGPFGVCPPDGFCNIHDANHALQAFDGTSACSCPLGAAPSFEPEIVDSATLRLAANRRAVKPGEEVRVSVFIDNALDDLQSYQLGLEVNGGRRGRFELVDITIETRPTRAFRGRSDRFEASNIQDGRMLNGLDANGVETGDGAYLATYTYRISDDAAGSFVIDVASDNQTFLIASLNGMIEIERTSPAVVVVATGSAKSVR